MYLLQQSCGSAVNCPSHYAREDEFMDFNHSFLSIGLAHEEVMLLFSLPEGRAVILFEFFNYGSMESAAYSKTNCKKRD
jgi:hypothetical protein